MIDKQITIKRLEDLQREVARIEFSCTFKPGTVEAAIKARISVETLMRALGKESDD